MTGTTEHRAALAAAVGSAVLETLAARGIVAEPNLTGHPATGAARPPRQLDARRSRWVSTSETYLGAAAHDPANALRGILGTQPEGPGGGGDRDGAPHEVRRVALDDPAHLQGRLRPLRERGKYGEGGEGSGDEDVRGGYGG